MPALSSSKSHHIFMLLGFIIVASILVFIACHFHILPQIKRIEQHAALQQIDRLRLNFDNELQSLTTVAQDYITYTSMLSDLETQDTHFWQQSLPDNLLTDHGLTDAAIYTSTGQLISGRGLDHGTANFRLPNTSLCEKVLKIAGETPQRSITGLVAGKRSLIMVTAHSLTSLLNASGPIIILCKPLTNQILDHGAPLFQSDITIRTLPLAADDLYSQRAMSHLSEHQQVFLQQTTDNRFTAHARLIDLNQQPLGLLQFTLSHGPYFEVERKVSSILSLLLVALTLITLQLVNHLKKGIRQPFDKLTQQLQRLLQQRKNGTLQPTNGAKKLTYVINQLLVELTHCRQNQNCSEIETELIKRVVPCAIFTIDQNQLITCWNERAEQLTGYSANEMIGTPHCRFIQETCQTHSNDAMNHHFSSHTPEKKYTIYHKNGSLLTVAMHSEPLCDGDGIEIGRIECFTDTTSHERDKDELTWQLTLNQHLSNLSQTMVQYFDNEEKVAQEILCQARQITNSAHGFVATSNLCGKQWLLDYTSLFDEFRTADNTAFIPPIPPGRGSLLHAVYNHRNGVLFNKLQQLNVAHLAGVIDKPFCNFMAVPIWRENTIIGQLALANNKNGYTAREIQAVGQLAELFSVLLAKNDHSKRLASPSKLS